MVLFFKLNSLQKLRDGLLLEDLRPRGASSRRVPFRKATSVIMPSISITSLCSMHNYKRVCRLSIPLKLCSAVQRISHQSYERYKYSGVELEYPKYIKCQQHPMQKKKNNEWCWISQLQTQISTITLVEKYETAIKLILTAGRGRSKQKNKTKKNVFK